MVWKKIKQCQAGLITKTELFTWLKGHEIHGHFRLDGSFTGYDYSYQRVVDTRV